MSSNAPDDHLPLPQRRIRHITSLQVRNLTPFPARDALAQTLTQPGPSSISLPSQPADDIELTVASRRRRRISAGSVVTMLHLDPDDEGFVTGTKRQTRSGSRGSFQSLRNAASGSQSSTIRSRPRTSSKASSVHLPTALDPENVGSDLPTDQDEIPNLGHFVTHSQRALEKIVSSRLVETFVTLTLQPPTASHPPPQPSSPPIPTSASILSPRKGKDVSVRRAISASASAANHRRGTSVSSTSSTFSTSSTHINRPQSSVRPSTPASSRVKAAVSGRAPLSSPRAANFPSPPPTPPPGSPRLKPPPSSSNSPLTSENVRQRETGQVDQTPSRIPTPFYISPTHLPSTSPTFSHLDPEREFASWADISGTRVKVTIWGNSRRELSRKVAEKNKALKGKGKETAGPGDIPEGDHSWKVLDEWLVDLDDMEPLPPDLATHHLPSNTLLLTLSSSQVFHIPPVSSLNLPPVPSRDPSPLGPEYNSDGEIEDLRRSRSAREANDSGTSERETLEKSLKETRIKKSATWQDLVKVVNLHSCVVDTQELLEGVVRNCDTLMEDDGYNASSRECSEREEWIVALHAEQARLTQHSAQVREANQARRNTLQSRRNTLATARSIHNKDVSELLAQVQEVASERRRYSTIASSLHPLRTALIQTVSFIFPIEPLSAPDLLFTILGAPLPIPSSSSDPAPPLSLPSQPDITEDTTATALGYVAQVVQLVSAYLGKGLTYPVTCCGSRSVIKDPISAMMGPRIFPLYSKGVETYRFEYGVFLLNKDIEMLMMDRNLCAMDMRHTLPNLKNLLLTLTTGEEVKPVKQPVSPTALASVISPARAISPLALNAQSGTTSQTSSSLVVGAVPRKPTPFLSPLAAILRARYPSSAGRPSVKVVDETPEPAAEDDGAADATTDQPGIDLSGSIILTEQEETKSTNKLNGIQHTPPPVNENGGPIEKLTVTVGPPTVPQLPGIT